MNLRSQSCDDRRITSLIERRMSVVEEAAMAEHLSGCSACRKALEDASAGQRLWQKAELYLRDDDELSLPSSGTESQCGPNGGRIVDQVLESLAPTDDPEMLGRVGEYEVSGVIGFGGMGVVLKGFDRSLKRVVAIKVMAPHLASCGPARKRFAREAQAAAAITHDNVIDIYGVSESNGLPFLVMPYARGTSLQKRIDEEGSQSVVEVLRIGIQVASGLAAAHAQGLVHRDIKPANILLNDGIDRLVITDFGLARAVDDASVTRTGVIAGTPQYMSPEQARGESIDHRSDLFSLGSLVYALCTGRPPFRAETTFGILRRITDNEPRSIREINPEVPEWLCAIIGKLMAKEADGRFDSAEQVAELLEECLAHVQQPTAVTLPKSLTSRGSFPVFVRQPIRTGAFLMVSIFSSILLAMLIVQSWKEDVSKARDSGSEDHQTTAVANNRADKRSHQNARSAVESYVASALAGDVVKAASLAKSSPADPKRIAEMQDMFNVQRLKIKTVYVNEPANPTKALATSEAARLEEEHKQPDGQRDGFLVFTLQRTDAGWFVNDIDFESEEGADEELKRFLKSNPNSIGLPPIDRVNVEVVPEDARHKRVEPLRGHLPVLDHSSGMLLYARGGTALVTTFGGCKSNGFGVTDDDPRRGIVSLLSVTTGKKVAEIDTGAKTCHSDEFIAVSRDGSKLAVAAGDQFLAVWDISSNDKLNQPLWRVDLGANPELQRFARYPAFSADGSKLAVRHTQHPSHQASAGIHTLNLYDVTTGSQIADVKLDGWYGRIAFFPDGRSLIACVRNTRGIVTLRQFDSKSLEPMSSVALGRMSPFIVTKSDNMQVVFGGMQSGVIGIANVKTRKVRSIARQDRSRSENAFGDYSISSLAVSPDGRFIATGGQSGKPTIRVWDGSSGRLLKTLQHPAGHGGVWGMDFSPDSSHLATGARADGNGVGARMVWETQDSRLKGYQ